MNLEIGKFYRFKKEHRTLKTQLLGRRYKLVSDHTIYVYDERGNLIKPSSDADYWNFSNFDSLKDQTASYTMSYTGSKLTFNFINDDTQE